MKFFPSTAFRHVPDHFDAETRVQPHIYDWRSLLSAQQQFLHLDGDSRALRCIVLEPHEGGCVPARLCDHEFADQPIYLRHEGRLVSPSFTGVHRSGSNMCSFSPSTSYRQNWHPNCSLCDRVGCWDCRQLFIEDCSSFVVVGHYEPTGLEWFRCTYDIEERAHKAIAENRFGEHQGVSYRVEPGPWRPSGETS